LSKPIQKEMGLGDGGDMKLQGKKVQILEAGGKGRKGKRDQRGEEQRRKKAGGEPRLERVPTNLFIKFGRGIILVN